jgi:hypothetical protein
MAKPKPEKTRAPEGPAPTRVLPIELRIGDRLTDETGTYEVVARPYRTKRAWAERGLDGDAVSELLRNTGRALRAAYKSRVGAAFGGAPYDTRDLPAILAALRAAPGVWHPPIQGEQA